MSKVCLNLWSFHLIDVYDAELFDKYCDKIVNNISGVLENDAARTLSQLKHKKYNKSESMEKCIDTLIKYIVRNGEKFSLQPLSVACNTMAEMGIQDDYFFGIVKEKFMH